MELEFKQYVRMPFTIEAVQITEDNMEDLCDLIGHEIKQKNGSRFIVVNRKIIPNGSRAFAGWWVTKMGEKIRAYPNKIFIDQFTLATDELLDTYFGITDDPDEEDDTEAEDVVGYVDDVPVVEED